MANFKFLFCLMLLTGCATAEQGHVSPSVVPEPKQYTCEQEKEAAAAWVTLPPTIRSMMDDYHTERVTLGRLHGGKGAPACVK